MIQEIIKRVDSEDMYGAVHAFPEQLQDARQRALEQVHRLEGLRSTKYRGVVVAGMGGSAIGGDLLRAMSHDVAKIPIAVNRGYSLPAWVDEQCLVIASSYSGNTEESLAAFSEAQRRGAAMFCITTGGTLQDRAVESGMPVISLRPGLQPRAALSYSGATLLTACDYLGLVTIPDEDWHEAAQVLQAHRSDWDDPTNEQNPALGLAHALQLRFPVVYSSEQLEVVNLRWRNQMHENAKTFAVGNLLPEMNHNEIMGWARSGKELKSLGVVVLRDQEDHPRTQRRLDVTASLLQPLAGHWEEIHSTGKGRLARLLSLMYHSDWVSFYLAILHQTDPSPVGLISTLKKRLAEG